MKKTKRARAAAVEAVYHKFAAQPPQITGELMKEIDARCENIENRIVRRLALHALRLSGARLIDIAKSRADALAFAELSLGIEQFEKHLRNLADLMATATCRVQLSLCSRADMSELFKEARANDSSESITKNESFLRLVVDNTNEEPP
jgi:hypothetical protein